MKFLIAFLAFLGVASGAKTVDPFGIVSGITDCGSLGTLGPVSVTDCDEIPCYFTPGRAYAIGITFTASMDSSNLMLHVYQIKDDVHLFLFLVPINGEIEAGKEFVLNFQLPVNDNLPGHSDILFQILNNELGLYEICAQAAVVIG